ncbi:MAG: DUF4920 domain-containing protein [bacterium]|nr:DUF4920 domain-containing protein [bacterium]
MRFQAALVCALLILNACSATSKSAALPAGDVVGEAMEPRDVVAFAVVDADPPSFFDQTVLVEATATAVCQKAGCWMQVEDEGRTAMVRWETGCGGKYAFPADMVGRRILIQGSFYPKVLSEEDAQHIEEEAAEGVEIEREGYEFNASSILVIAATE